MNIYYRFLLEFIALYKKGELTFFKEKEAFERLKFKQEMFQRPSIRKLPDSEIRSRVPWDSELGITLLMKASTSLTVSQEMFPSL